MKRVVLPAAASVILGGVVSLVAVVIITMSAQENVRPDLSTSTDISTSVDNDVQYGNR